MNGIANESKNFREVLASLKLKFLIQIPTHGSILICDLYLIAYMPCDSSKVMTKLITHSKKKPVLLALNGL